MSSHPPIVFLGAKRTPFGAFNGALADVSATELGVIASKAALAQAGVNAEDVDHVIFGNVMQTSADAIYLARHIGLKVGAPIATPAVTVNRLCGSGFESLVQGAHRLLLGESTMILAGGTENMSQAPHTLRGLRKGLKLGGAPMGDSLQEALFDTYVGAPMAITAENLAVKYGITREQSDELAVSSQKRTAAAQEAGRFKAEIVPIEIASKKATVTFATDEHPRAQTTMETLAKLPPVFKKDGVVTAGNASGICDGAAMLVLTSAEFAQKNGLKPLARFVSSGVAGVEPSLMGIGPVPAIKAALARASVSADKIDLFEVNEAFAPQYLAVEK